MSHEPAELQLEVVELQLSDADKLAKITEVFQILDQKCDLILKQLKERKDNFTQLNQQYEKLRNKVV